MAVNKNVRSSTRKIALILDFIKGKKADVAIRDLEFTRKRIAHDVKKTVKSAIANAENNYQYDIDSLYSAYKEEYSEEKYHFEMPFNTDYQGMAEKEISDYKKNNPSSSVLYRYPSKTDSEEWSGAYGFEVNSYISTIKKLINDIARIRQAIT